jgi:hypothetical protein
MFAVLAEMCTASFLEKELSLILPSFRGCAPDSFSSA